MTITVTPLAERFGAEISGVDLTNLSTETFDAVRGAFEAHGVIVFRGQPMDRARDTLFTQLTETSHQQQEDIEAADADGFNDFLNAYFARAREPRRKAAV